MNSTTPRRTKPTILRVEVLCFLGDEVLLSRVVDPSEEFDVVLDGGGALEGGDGGADAGVEFELVGANAGVGAGFGPAGVGVGAGPIDGEGGDADGAMLVLNGFPSFLKFGMFSKLAGTGPENWLFSIFKSFRGRSCKTLSVPDSWLSCMCNVVKDAKLFIEGGNTPVKLLEERSKFTSPLSESKASGRSPFRLLPLTDMAVRFLSFDSELGMLPVSWLAERKLQQQEGHRPFHEMSNLKDQMDCRKNW
jgi:hypothetical protein